MSTGTGLFYGTDGNLTKIPDPSPATSGLGPSAISNSGFIVTNGTAEDVISPNGDITPVTARGGITSLGLSGISDKGEVVGNYRDSGDINHPFYERIGGSAKPFDVPITPDPTRGFPAPCRRSRKRSMPPVRSWVRFPTASTSMVSSIPPKLVRSIRSMCRMLQTHS